MNKLILVDGNNLVFRSYYATAYSGNMMKNSKGFPTNAIYGFVTMMNKIIAEEKPNYIAVAFDIGKNFRKEKYDFYKDGRVETPNELIMQFPYAKKILKAMGIKSLELEPYEADDIIGTLAHQSEVDPDFIATIISSDKDLLQLLSDEVDIKLLKSHDYIRYNPETFEQDYGIKPIRVIDLKALAGDSSDNIPGVKGIGEKTALKLLKEYDTLENIYDNIDKISGKVKEKLITDRDNAFMSKDIATIYKEVPLNLDLEDLKYEPQINEELIKIYEELEFYSLLKNIDIAKHVEQREFNYTILTNANNLKLESPISFYLECDNENYHFGNIVGMGISDKNNSYFVVPELIKDVVNNLNYEKIYTYDLKKAIVLLNKLDVKLPKVSFDLMNAIDLLNYNLKDDIAYLMKPDNYDVTFLTDLKKTNFVLTSKLEKEIALKSQYILDTYDFYINKLKEDKVLDLYFDVEMPLIRVLANMEIAGLKVETNKLDEMKVQLLEKIAILQQEIYTYAGCEFNIASPKQLGEVIFDKLALGQGKHNKKGYKTDIKTLQKLINVHPIIRKVLEYRENTKLLSTYVDGLKNYVDDNNYIHTIFKQNYTRTGRLSSTEPNLQNIPTRKDEGKKIREAFIPRNDLIMCIDYSQIELRILAHVSESKELIAAFKNDQDIHTKVAADIHGISEDLVDKKMRSTAKAVIFGIIYGISGFGLGENLEINPKEAKKFIDKYLELYPGVKNYMDSTIKQAYELGYVTTLFNRKRKIDELYNQNYMVRQQGERIALNTPIQGTSADIIKMAMIEIDKRFKQENIKSIMILQVHDELIFDVLKEEQAKVAHIAKEVMENIVNLKVPLKISIDTGINWYLAK